MSKMDEKMDVRPDGRMDQGGHGQVDQGGSGPVDAGENGSCDAEARTEFDEGLSSVMKDLAENSPEKIPFYEGFDGNVPSADEMFGTIVKGIGETFEAEEFERMQTRKRRRRFAWFTSGALAACVAVVVLVTTVWTPGAFLNGGGDTGSDADYYGDDVVSSDQADTSLVAEDPVTEVTPAELPAPQKDYETIYDTMIADTDLGSYVEEMRASDDVTAEEAMPAETSDAAPAPALEESSSAAPAPAITEGTASEDAAAESIETEASPSLDGQRDKGGDEPEFSDTNVQTEGVQEADIVKTDGKYIYTLNSESICITEARDGHPEVLSEIDQVLDDGQVYFEMYINGDTLTLVRNGYNLKNNGKVDGSALKDSAVIEYEGDSYDKMDSSVDIYDVSDRENPRKVGSLSQSGSYADSRMIGDKLYLISTYDSFAYDAVDRSVPRTYVPLFAEGDEQIVSKPKEIRVPTSRINYMSYTVISGINTSKAKFVSHESILGCSHTVYASKDNLYLSESRSGGGETEVGGFYIYLSSSYTRVTRLSLSNGKVKMKASADIPGYVNDQFSLDEYDGNLRVVTTTDSYTEAYLKDAYYDGEYYDDEYYEDEDYDEEYYEDEDYDEENYGEDPDYKAGVAAVEKKYGKLKWDYYEYGYKENQSSGLYILNNSLKVLGKVDNLAQGEKVYSCRFLGDVAYFVTFENVDPLFSVDVSNPKKPKVMGKLKIPGFSEYLHPYADGLLFGLGSDADESSGTMESLKVSMFDNSDPYDVKEKDKLIFDDLEYSYVADNHKAILIDERKSLIAFPADSSYVILNYDSKGGFKRVMDVNVDDGGITYGRVDGYTYEYNGLRGLFIGDILYVVTPNSIHAYDMENGYKEVGSVTLASGAFFVDKESYDYPDGYDYDYDDYDDYPIEMYGE